MEKSVEINEQRLERIESKLDKVSYSVADFARIEERLLSAFKRLERHEKQIDRHQDDIKTLTSSVLTNSRTLQFGERMFWIVVTAAVSLTVYLGNS
jgi:DNA repair ATPase RecN